MALSRIEASGGTDKGIGRLGLMTDAMSVGVAPEVRVAESLEESRSLATAAKRKLQRLLGAQAALKRVLAEGRRPSGLVEAKAEVDEAQAVLATMLEESDGGDAHKRALRDYHESEGMSEYVRSTAAVRLYREAVEAEEAAVRKHLEAAAKHAARLRQCKERYAYCQGALYALIEIEATGGGGDQGGAALTDSHGGSLALTDRSGGGKSGGTRLALKNKGAPPAGMAAGVREALAMQVG